MIGLRKPAECSLKRLNWALAYLNALSLEVEPRRVSWSVYFATRFLAFVGYTLFLKESFGWRESELRLVFIRKFGVVERNLADIEAEYSGETYWRPNLSKGRVLLNRARALEESSLAPRGWLFRRVRVVRLVHAKHVLDRASTRVNVIWRLYMGSPFLLLKRRAEVAVIGSFADLVPLSEDALPGLKDLHKEIYKAD